MSNRNELQYGVVIPSFPSSRVDSLSIQVHLPLLHHDGELASITSPALVSRASIDWVPGAKRDIVPQFYAGDPVFDLFFSDADLQTSKNCLQVFDPAILDYVEEREHSPAMM